MRRALRRFGGPSPVARAGLWLLSAGAATSVLGYAAWAVLARALPAAEVGRAASAVALLVWVAVAVTAGVAPTVTATLPSAGPDERRRLVASAATTVTVPFAALAVVAAAVAAVTPVSPALALAAWVLAAVSAWGMLADAALIGVGRPAAVFARALVAGAARVAAALAVAACAFAVTGTLAAFAVALTLALAVAVASAVRAGIPPGFAPPAVLLSGRAAAVGWNQAATVAAQLPAALLPLVVTARADAAAAAGFYMAWLLASGCALVAAAASPALLAAASRPDHRGAAVRSAVRFTAVLLVPAVAATVAVGPFVLSFLGAEYRAAYPFVVALAVASAPAAVTSLASALWRATGRTRAAAQLNTAMAAVTVTAAYLLVPVWGAAGAVWAFAFVQATASVGILAAARRARRVSPGRP